MKYSVRPTTKFQKDLKRVQRRGYDLSLLTDIIKKLAEGETLPERNKDHRLAGDYSAPFRFPSSFNLALCLAFA